jgi:glutamate racemase
MSKPIGIFDSGVGGLTVLKALRGRLPHSDFVYVADTARVPYGRKPKEMVRGFASEIAWFLQKLDVSAIVVACNTASACALPDLAERMPVPVWGVIDPGVEAARRVTRTGHVGVIGTKATIASGVYQGKLIAAGLMVWAQACPMFVHLVEEALADSSEAEVLARHYLSSMPRIDTLILGCTHYPVLAPVIQRVVGAEVTLVSSAEVTAEVVSRAFMNSPDGRGRVTHYVTGGVPAYQHTAEVIGGVDGQVIPLDVTRLADAGVIAG